MLSAGRRDRVGPFLLPAVVGILTGAAIYELAVALGWIDLGTQPGEGPAGEGLVLGLASPAMLVGVVYCAFAAIKDSATARLERLLPISAAVLVLTRFYGFDPYYLPTLRRFSDDGAISPAWIYVVVVTALIVGVLIVVRRRIGLSAAALMLLVCLGTLLFEGAGH